MAKQDVALYAFNRGLVSKYGLARTDVRRLALSATTQQNYIPKVLGAMSLRPGLGMIGTPDGNNQAINIPFVFEIDDTALLEFTDSKFRVRVNEALVTRASVSTTITNGDFSSFVGWTDDSDSGGSAVVSGGFLNLVITSATGEAKCYQLVNVSSPDRGVRHALRIVVVRGPVTLRVGTTAGDDSYVAETTLLAGTHSITLTPTTNFYIEFAATTSSVRLVDSIAIEAAGILELPTPWTTDLLPLIRWDQSADVIFIACNGTSQFRIERRDGDSWSIVEYFPLDGPFLTANITNITLTPSALHGNITLAASARLFKTGHVGALFKITSSGQLVRTNLHGDDEFSDAIQVSGVGVNFRRVTINIGGVWTGTLTLQQSIDDGLSWTSTGTTFTANTSNFFYDDGLDNQIIQYRIGFVLGDFGSGPVAVINMQNPGGGIVGTVRITSVVDAENAEAEVLKGLGGLNPTVLWSEGAWSTYRGFPSVVSLYEGRIWWAGKGKLWGSISDAYADFDEDVEGDSGTIARNIGRGPIDKMNWMLPIERLFIGSDGSEISSRSSTIDEILTPTNSNLKATSTRGSDPVPAVIVDQDGFFVHRSGKKLMRISPSDSGLGYQTSDVSIFIPEILASGITRIAVQRLPETRIHCVLGNGDVAVLVFDDIENVQAWIIIHTRGEVEDVAVLPGGDEDLVYYMVNRNIGGHDPGVQTRFLERFAFEDQCVGGDYNYQADCHLVFTFDPPQATINIPHLIGEHVIVWADGKDFSPGFDDDQRLYTVDGSGNIGLGVPVSHAVVGLGYSSKFISSKLAYAAQMGTALLQPKIVNQVGIIAVDMHRYGLKTGQDEDHLEDLPGVEKGQNVDPDYIWTAYDNPTFPVSGTWDTDARLVLKSYAPRPATILAAVIAMTTSEKT